MKIQYKFADETIEIEVADEWGELIVDLDRKEDSSDRKKRRYCYSLDSKEYEGKEYGAIDHDIEAIGEDEEPTEEELLHAGIANLTDKQRAVIRMYFFENKTLDEIGEALGITKVAAFTIKKRALVQLKKYFPTPR